MFIVAEVDAGSDEIWILKSETFNLVDKTGFLSLLTRKKLHYNCALRCVMMSAMAGKFKITPCYKS